MVLDRKRMVRWLGGVSQNNYEKIILQIEKMYDDDPEEWINLLITTSGGQRAVAVAFYQYIRLILKPKLCTIGFGEVDSAGQVIFAAGQVRLVAPGCTFYFHEMSREYEKTVISTSQAREMAKEMNYCQEFSAKIVADISGGKLSMQDVVTMMEQERALIPEDIVKMGIADNYFELN